MSISDAAENAILNIVFLATAWANYADNAGTSPQTNIGCSLHTSDPTDSGTASTNEISYTSYTRVNVARSGSGWTTPSGGSISPQASIDFPACTGGSGTVTHWATAKSNASPPTGTQALLWTGTVSPNLSITSGDTPKLSTSSTITID